MRYYKIIQDGAVIGAGTMFLKWYESRGSFYYCDLNDGAERVQDVITETLYHADWLSGAPGTAYPSPEAEVVLIDATEYDEIVALLSDGEEIPVEPDPEPAPEPVPEPPDEPAERPMTVQEMRQTIAAQAEQIAMLTDCILEMSEVVYGE